MKCYWETGLQSVYKKLYAVSLTGLVPYSMTISVIILLWKMALTMIFLKGVIILLLTLTTSKSLRF